MRKDTIQRYILDKKEDIKKLFVEKRELEIAVTKRFVTSVIGPRRAGKTYYLYDLILNKLKLKDSSYIFINFEDIDMKAAKAKDIISTINMHEEIYGNQPEYLFFDEVQNLEDWQELVYTLFEKKKYFIFISGSTSKLLSKELSTELRGRALSYLLLPFSFAEFLKINKFEKKEFYSSSEENQVKNLLRKYIQIGGFPDVAFEEKIRDKFFKDYIELLIFKDIVERFKIKNISLIRFLITAALSSFSKEFSIYKNFKLLKGENIKVSKKTLYSYAMLLEDSFFSFFVKKFSSSSKKSSLSIPKVYINDTGLVSAVHNIKFEEEPGGFIENCVFLGLKKLQGKNPNMNIFYYKSQTGKETDFVIAEKSAVNQLVQVCYSLENKDTRAREIDALLSASKELKCNNLSVITWDTEKEEKINRKKIKFVPLWKWLLEK